MLYNYLKIAWRNLVKGKLYSVINISGLAIGIACCLLIGLYVYEELRYDRFHSDSDRIYRVNMVLSNEIKTDIIATTPRLLALFLRNQFPEVENVASVEYQAGVIRKENELFETTFAMTDHRFFEVFDFEVIEGNPLQSMQNPSAVFLSSSMAAQLFGESEAIGQSVDLRIDGNFYTASVAGIVKDAPSYSSITYEVLVPQTLWEKAYPTSNSSTNWGTLTGIRYAKLVEGADLTELEEKLNAAQREQVPEQFVMNRTLRFQNIRDIHTSHNIMWSQATTVSPYFIGISVIIAILILSISCINFTTLSIGHSTRRVREVGMRKALGAQRRQLIGQFWGETFFVALFSLLFGLLLTESLLPYFSYLVGKELTVSFTESPAVLLLIIGIVLTTGLMAGSYPALYLSGFKPSQVFRSTVPVKGKHRLIPVLTTVQFGLAIALIIGTIFMNKQMNLMADKSLGYNEEYVLQIETPYKEGKAILKRMRAGLSGESDIQGISASWNALDGEGVSFNDAPYTSEGIEIHGSEFGVDPKLADVLKLEILEGRDLKENTAGQQEVKEALVNEELVQAFGWGNPLGKNIEGHFGDLFTVVGVVKNFHFQSLHQEITPLIVYPMDYFTTIYLRVNSEHLSETISKAETAWKQAAPGLPFQFSFLDDQIEQQYRSDQRWAQIIRSASVIAILISCMGLFGLATLSSTKRLKEIGIRKILGATIPAIVTLLSKDFLKPVLAGLLVAIPLSFVFMNWWLKDFAYKIELDWVTVLLAVMVSIVLALISISWQSIRAALANPAKSLRTE